MRPLVISHLQELFESYQDLVHGLPEEALSRKLSIPSNTVGAQFWCVIGARESHIQGIRQNAWDGFNCSLSVTDIKDKETIRFSLERTAVEFEDTLDGISWTETRDALLLKLLQHEAQHQGQLIRYVFGLGYTFPDSWKSRWSL